MALLVTRGTRLKEGLGLHDLTQLSVGGEVRIKSWAMRKSLTVVRQCVGVDRSMWLA